MVDRNRVIDGLRKAAEELARYAPMKVNGRCQVYFDMAIHVLKEQEYARCLNCQFRDFGENEVDSWDICKLHKHNTSPDEYCSWFVERKGEVG